jgi:hypothetical protein
LKHCPTVSSDITPKLLKDKVRNMKTSYINARKWAEKTGQGIKEDDGVETFEGILNHLVVDQVLYCSVQN